VNNIKRLSESTRSISNASGYKIKIFDLIWTKSPGIKNQIGKSPGIKTRYVNHQVLKPDT